MNETTMFLRSSSTCTEEDIKVWKIGCSAVVSGYKSYVTEQLQLR